MAISKEEREIREVTDRLVARSRSIDGRDVHARCVLSLKSEATVADLEGLVEGAEPKLGKRGPYKKRAA
jgi:hypothetical protein